MTPNDGNLLSKSIYNGPDCLRVRNGSLLPIKHLGFVMFLQSISLLSYEML